MVAVAVFSQPNGAPNHSIIVCGLGSHGCGRGTFPRHRGRMFSLAGFVFVRKEGPHWIAIVTPEAELPTAVLRGISYSGLPNRYCIYTGSSPYAYGQKSFDFTSPCRFLCCADRRERHALQHVPAMQPHQRTTFLRFVAAGPRRPAATGVGGPVPM